MKKIIFFTLAAVALLLSPEVFAQQGIGTNQPHRSAALDIVSTKRGLLIPRMAIPDLQQPDPVTDPAHALLVFNNGEAGGTTPGFYWWNENANGGEGAWKAVTAEAGDPGEIQEITLIGVNPIQAQQTDDNEWTISLNLGDDGQLLVTELDEESNELVAVWKNPEDIFDAGEAFELLAHNGLTVDDDGAVILGGELDQATVIATHPDDGATLAITNLEEIDTESPYDLVVMDDNGILHKVDPSVFGGEGVQPQNLEVDGPLTFLDGTDGMGAVLVPTTIGLTAGDADQVLTTVEDPDNPGQTIVVWADASVAQIDLEANNGLHIDTDSGDVYLGGTLVEVTTIETSEDNTLAIDGLQAAAAPNKIVVAEDAEGVLRTVTRSLEAEVSGDFDVANMTGYTAYVQEITLNVPITGLSSADLNLNLPAATGANGQVINVKLSGDTEADHYLIIQENGTEIAYGALPYQAWILKSNGTNWVIVGRN